MQGDKGIKGKAGEEKKQYDYVREKRRGAQRVTATFFAL